LRPPRLEAAVEAGDLRDVRDDHPRLAQKPQLEQERRAAHDRRDERRLAEELGNNDRDEVALPVWDAPDVLENSIERLLLRVEDLEMRSALRQLEEARANA